MGSKVRNLNLSLNHSKNPPNPTKFYQLSSFDIPHKMSIKKTPNQTRTKIIEMEQWPARVAARVEPRAKQHRRPGSSPCAILTQKQEFSPLTSNSYHFQSKTSLYNIPTPSVTSYNI